MVEIPASGKGEIFEQRSSQSQSIAYSQGPLNQPAQTRRNRTAELPNREFGTHKAPAFSKLRSLWPLAPTVTRLTLGSCATISERKISPEKQRTSWRSKWDSNSRFGQRNFAFENATEFRAAVANWSPEKISRLRCYLRLVRPVSAVRLFGRVPGSPLSVSLRQSALVFLHQCSRELSYEWLHEERVVMRSNVHLHSKRIELCSNNRPDGRNDDAFEALP